MRTDVEHGIDAGAADDDIATLVCFSLDRMSGDAGPEVG